MSHADPIDLPNTRCERIAPRLVDDGSGSRTTGRTLCVAEKYCVPKFPATLIKPGIRSSAPERIKMSDSSASLYCGSPLGVDFVADQLADSSRFRSLTVVDILGLTFF